MAKLTQQPIHTTPINVSIHKLRFEAKRLGKVLQRLVITVPVTVGTAAIIVSFRAVGINMNSLRKLLYGLLEVAQSGQVDG
jgi:hypothetical protein